MTADSKPRVRFAPSPTGRLHVGGARTALFNWLFARHAGGQMVLRIEDTDPKRSRPEFERALVADLQWLGLDWDEGPDRDGGVGPYRQSERRPLYMEAAARLVESGHVYPTFDADVAAEEPDADEDVDDAPRAQRPARGTRPRGPQSPFDATEVAQQVRSGHGPALRFRLPDGLIHYHDRLRGNRAIDAGTLSDFVLLRSDGLPTYNFACVVDDAHMRISHVIRASEHLYNTARQVVLYDALGYSKPEFAHVSLILDEQRRKLSKREGQQSTAQVYVDEYRAQGYIPDALVNYLVLLGWSSPTGDEILDRERLVREFDIDRVSKSGAIFDVQKLRWMAGEYIRAASPQWLVQQAVPLFQRAGMDADAGRVAQSVRTFQTQVACLAELPERVREVLDAGPPQGEAVAVLESRRAVDVLDVVAAGLVEAAGGEDPAAYKQIVLERGRTAGVKGKDLFMPVRVALTGRLHGPDIGELVALLGVEESVRRLRAAAALARAAQGETPTSG